MSVTHAFCFVNCFEFCNLLYNSIYRVIYFLTFMWPDIICQRMYVYSWMLYKYDWGLLQCVECLHSNVCHSIVSVHGLHWHSSLPHDWYKIIKIWGLRREGTVNPLAPSVYVFETHSLMLKMTNVSCSQLGPPFCNPHLNSSLLQITLGI